MTDFAAPEQAFGQTAVLQGHGLLPDGVYWRVTGGRRLQLPAGPVVLRRWFGEFTSGRVRSSRPLSTDVRPDRPLVLFPQAGSQGGIPGWLWLEGDGDLRVAAVAPMLAGNGRPIELAVRAEPPWGLASAYMNVVLVTGEGSVDSVEITCFDGNSGRPDNEALSVDALPDPYLGVLPCYAVPHADVADWKGRVLAGAANEPVPYAPGLPWGAFASSQELERVEALSFSADSVDGWLAVAYGAVERGASDEIEVTGDEDPSSRVGARHNATAALSTAALDPGISRLLARTGTLDIGVPNWQDRGRALLFAQVPFLESAVSGERELTDLERIYDDALGGGYRELLQHLSELPEVGDGRRLESTMLAVPLPAILEPSPSSPQRPNLAAAGPAAWAEDGTPSWRQPIELGGVAPLGPVSLVRTQPVPGTLHDHHELVSSPLFASWRQPRGPATVTAVTVVDERGLAGPSPGDRVEWEIRHGDWIGQWSEAAPFAADPPRRPPPPPCVVEAVFVRGSVATGDMAASPGDVTVVLTASRAEVPGAAALDRITWSVDGTDQPALAIPAGLGDARFSRSVAVPAMRPGEARIVRVRAVTVDVVGNSSEPTSTDVAVGDPRPAPGPHIAPRLLVTSRPSTDPEVSITLSVAAHRAAHAYRFYVANEASIRAASGLSTVGYRNQPRAARASDLRGVGGGPRSCYTLARLQPVLVQDGHATTTIVLPSGTNDVVAVRAVSVTQPGGTQHEGVAAPFADVDPAYVVVPYDDTPGVPTLVVTSPGPGRVFAVVTLEGVGAELERYSPEPVEVRLVEFVPDVDPVFWPEVAVLPLQSDGQRLKAATELSAPGWRRIGVAASVRYPTEAVLEAGASPEAGDVTAAGQDGPPNPIISPWGPLSVPHWVDVVGPQPTVDVTPDPAGNLVVRVDPLPPGGEGPAWSAELYRGFGSLEFAERRLLSAEAPEFTVAAPGAPPPPPAPPERIALVLVEPFGRRHDPIELTPA